MSGLPPGEHVIKETGMLPVSWANSPNGHINGKLTLTNRRLFFVAGRLQGLVGSFQGVHGDRVEILLSTITSVEKGFMAHIDIMAGGQQYTFKGMGGAGDWIKQINATRMTAGTPQSHIPQTRSTPPPPPMASGNKFCPNCGAVVVPGNNFCGGCGARVA